MEKLTAPFPYFGGKSWVADIVWERFGRDVRSYVEPFCGSMAMLLANRHPVGVETVNDLDGLLTNFWRAIKYAPEEVADLAGVPSTSIDLTARHNWVYKNKERVEKMQEDPFYYDIEAAAFWVYARSSSAGPRGIFREKIGNRVPKLGSPLGIHADRRRDLINEFSKLSERLRNVAICYGSWENVVKHTPLKHGGTPSAVFLDPPYQEGEYDDGLYEHAQDNLMNDVVQWCVENGEDPELRIALCGYEGLEMPESWSVHAWKTGGGYGTTYRNEPGRGMQNTSRERIWFSPHCLNPIEVPEEIDFTNLLG